MKLMTWREMPIATAVPWPGCSRQLITGTWRSQRPVLDPEKCTHCLLCWLFCPDLCIPLSGEERLETDLNYCKGCGICAAECPYDAITMRPEAEFTASHLEEVLQ